MKRESELEFECYAASGWTKLNVKGSHEPENIKVILTEEVDEYVEINDGVYASSQIGLITESNNVSFKVKLKDYHSWWFKEDTNPSTKEAFDAQFKVKKMTDLEKYERVNSCETVKQLEDAILSFANENNVIKGRQISFNALTMASCVLGVVKGESTPNLLTREFGIRQQALYLRLYY